jgi:hypothetical protein
MITFPENNTVTANADTRPDVRSTSAPKASQLTSLDPSFDPAMVDHFWRLATIIADGSTVPPSFRKNKEGTPRPANEIVANCYRVVNQAHRWNFDPFGLIDHAQIIDDKICWEGKVVAAVLESLGGIKLKPTWTGEGEYRSITVVGFVDGDPREVSGSVAGWRTPLWTPEQYDLMLWYRAVREWGRMYAPETMMGVFTIDEMKPRETARSTPYIGGDTRPAADHLPGLKTTVPVPSKPGPPAVGTVIKPPSIAKAAAPVTPAPPPAKEPGAENDAITAKLTATTRPKPIAGKVKPKPKSRR